VTTKIEKLWRVDRAAALRVERKAQRVAALYRESVEVWTERLARRSLNEMNEGKTDA
jgi:hypothetical protein